MKKQMVSHMLMGVVAFTFLLVPALSQAGVVPKAAQVQKGQVKSVVPPNVQTQIQTQIRGRAQSEESLPPPRVGAVVGESNLQDAAKTPTEGLSSELPVPSGQGVLVSPSEGIRYCRDLRVEDTFAAFMCMTENHEKVIYVYEYGKQGGGAIALNDTIASGLSRYVNSSLAAGSSCIAWSEGPQSPLIKRVMIGENGGETVLSGAHTTTESMALSPDCSALTWIYNWQGGTVLFWGDGEWAKNAANPLAVWDITDELANHDYAIVNVINGTLIPTSSNTSNLIIREFPEKVIYFALGGLAGAWSDSGYGTCLFERRLVLADANVVPYPQDLYNKFCNKSDKVNRSAGLAKIGGFVWDGTNLLRIGLRGPISFADSNRVAYSITNVEVLDTSNDKRYQVVEKGAANFPDEVSMSPNGQYVGYVHDGNVYITRENMWRAIQ